MFEDIDTVISNNKSTFRSFFIDAIEQKNFDLLRHLVEKYNADYITKDYIKEGFFLSLLKGDMKIIDYLYNKYRKKIDFRNYEIIETAMWNDDVNVFKKIAVELSKFDGISIDLLTKAISLNSINIFKFLIEEYNLLTKDSVGSVIFDVLYYDRLDILKYIIDKFCYKIDSTILSEAIFYEAANILEYFGQRFPKKMQKLIENTEEYKGCLETKLALFYTKYKKWQENFDYLVGVEDLKSIHEELKNNKDVLTIWVTNTRDPQKIEYLYTNFLKKEERKNKNNIAKFL